MPENTIKQGIYRHYKGGIYEVINRLWCDVMGIDWTRSFIHVEL